MKYAGFVFAFVIGCFLIGRFSAMSVAPAGPTAVPVVHLTVMSSRNAGCTLMVKDTQTGLTGVIEPFTCRNAPKFEEGESVDMEIWHESKYLIRFVYKGDGVHPEDTYGEPGFTQDFITAVADKHTT